MKRLLIAGVLAVLVIPTPAGATAISYLIGDKDGFDVGIKPDEAFDPSSLPGYNGSGDGDGTDQWFYGQQSFTFTYSLPAVPVNEARIEVFSGGQGFNPFDIENGGPTSVYLNGTFIGYLTIGDMGLSDNNIARKDVIDLAPYLSLLTGSDIFRFRPYIGGAFGDGWTMDYLELTLQTRSVPEPRTYGLMSLGLVCLGLAIRRNPKLLTGR